MDEWMTIGEQFIDEMMLIQGRGLEDSNGCTHFARMSSSAEHAAA